jgi:hypothetical protein
MGLLTLSLYQRKPPPKSKPKGGKTLVGSVLNPPKQGRPPIGEKAMTPAERKAKQRKDDAIKDAFVEHRDDKGRTSVEVTATDVEAIAAAHDSKWGKYVDTTADTGEERFEERFEASVRPVRPEGHGADDFEADDFEPSTPNKQTAGPREVQRNITLSAAITNAADQMCPQKNGKYICRSCCFKEFVKEFDSFEEARKHMKKKYEQIESLLNWPEPEGTDSNESEEARKKLKNDSHWRAVKANLGHRFI